MSEQSAEILQNDGVHDKKRLKELQALPLDRKIQISQARIIEWYEHYGGQVYVSFSGGKDSTVLLDLVRRAYPEVPGVFADTGLEFPAIREFVKSVDNIIWIKPEMHFKDVIKTYGWCYPSKDVAQTIRYARTGNERAIRIMNAIDKNGNHSDFLESKYGQYRFLMDLPYQFSDQCCIIMKERPMDIYGKESGRKPYVGTTAMESQRRTNSWIQTGCNAFDSDRPRSMPLAFWTEQDILEYIYTFNIPYAHEIYGGIWRQKDDKYVNALEKRTGCMFCPIACHLDHPNKFERMKSVYPKLYEYCMKPMENGGLGMDKFLTDIGVEH